MAMKQGELSASGATTFEDLQALEDKLIAMLERIKELQAQRPITPENLFEMADLLKAYQAEYPKFAKLASVKATLKALAESTKNAKPVYKCVYVLKMSNNSVKIGCTGNFPQRMRTIETSSGLTVVDWCHTDYLPANEAFIIEHACHRFFNSQRIRGEFFNITLEEAQSELDAYAKIIESKSFTMPKTKMEESKWQ